MKKIPFVFAAIYFIFCIWLVLPLEILDAPTTILQVFIAVFCFFSGLSSCLGKKLPLQLLVAIVFIYSIFSLFIFYGFDESKMSSHTKLLIVSMQFIVSLFLWYCLRKFESNPKVPIVKTPIAEYIRPWKIITFLAGLILLVVGSFYFSLPDWDVQISFIMAATTYLTAPWSLRMLLEKRWSLLPIILFAAWFSVDGVYWLYWHFKNPVVLETMRTANFIPSLLLYCLCGIIWLYNGSLQQLLFEVRQSLKRRKT